MSVRIRRQAVVAFALVAALAGAACGSDDDDGAGVRESGPGASGSGSGSAASGSGASGSAASGSGASGSAASGSAASGPAECVLVGASDAEATTTVEVALTEFAVDPIPEEVPAGTVEFAATNDGEEPHELVIALYDGDPTDLPTAEDGTVDEEQLPEGSVIGEIEEFASGQSCEGTFELEAGEYVLFCNILEEEETGEMEAHYTEGMITTFTVT